MKLLPPSSLVAFLQRSFTGEPWGFRRGGCRRTHLPRGPVLPSFGHLKRL